MSKKIVYVDMDGVCADFDKARDAQKITPDPLHRETKVPEGFFLNLELIEGALEALHTLSPFYELYFLSTPQWSNPSSWKEKREWVEKHYGDLMFKRLILTHNKGLLKGHYLIDDRTHNGVEDFAGEHIHFGTEKFPDWKKVVEYLLEHKPVAWNSENPGYVEFMSSR